MASSGVINAIRSAILLLALVIFLGNIMMWIIMPTDTYYTIWVPHLMAATNSSFFGIQGPIMMDFTFPILLIAVLGCFYLHLGKKENAVTKSSSKARSLRLMRRPMIVKGLGIVTLTEIALFTMFIALCAWYFGGYVRHWFEQVYQRSLSKHEQVWQTKLDRVGIVTGVTGNLCLTFLFYPVTRGSSILPMLGLTSEASIKYHIWLGNLAMALFTVHGSIYFLYWIITHRLSEALKWGDNYVSNVAGEMSLLCGLAMWITSYPKIRRKMFELFLYTHYLYIFFMIFFIWHIGIGFACIMLPGFYLFLMDRYLRFLQSRNKARLVSARLLSCDIIELNFFKSRALSYNPTSTIFINVPSISKLQWHPFTIISNSNLEPQKLSVLIKCEGNWTRSLYDMLSSPSPLDRLEAAVEGPYGPAATHFLRHDTLVMISGGSGITPFISIIRELIFINSTLKCKTPKIMLISSFKNSSHLSILDLILPTSSTSNSCKLDLQVEAYVTREKGQLKEQIPKHRTIWFKPESCDIPISPTLGPNSWLCLAAIISSSFAIYLVLFGFFTQYVVYPVDQNINVFFSYTKKGSASMLFLCFSMVVAASTAFLWNKKCNADEAKQVQDMDESGSSGSTSNSSFDQDDVEMESLPLQSMIKSVNVHYGQRPNLKRILLEIKESSVGALVSGPKKMREEVAAICSSGQADNLEFESISFTW
ncbi:ferric reduction oxidase 2-like isoform X1 [Salvia miltiorrhiza]|uniref:ferric reduction oxidase 2-like isoform X1 n=1 Tax=Salvia miltiorrhiza TaxID=226208 RepID=UPI0025AB73A4|nr:ferric reduction oxidase 2-like isoform X1 [Salvia miltiorrhiza]